MALVAAVLFSRRWWSWLAGAIAPGNLLVSLGYIFDASLADAGGIFRDAGFWTLKVRRATTTTHGASTR
jgi:hypothetical protein